MLVLYFSGTGNSKYISEQFAIRMKAPCYSIEENVDFENLLQQTDTVAVSYPIYGSCVPMIMRKFVQQYLGIFQTKKLVIFCTQMLFSGDGVRAFARLIPGCDEHVIYAEHFRMPNNICNFFVFPMREKELVQKPQKALLKIEEICKDIQNGVVKKRGWNIFSTLLGKTQNIAYPKIEQKAKSSFQVDKDCIQCGICVKHCPMNNLKIVDGKVMESGQCTLCYRCVNICPKQSATVYIHRKPKKQYKGFEYTQKEL